jgi:hypothetical protein
LFDELGEDVELMLAHSVERQPRGNSIVVHHCKRARPAKR